MKKAKTSPHHKHADSTGNFDGYDDAGANKYQLYFETVQTWRFTPCDGKVPINPDTGSAKGMRIGKVDLTLDQIINANPPSVGTLLGVTQEQLELM